MSDPKGRSELENRLRRAGEYRRREPFDLLTMGECSFGIDLSNDVMSEYEERELEDIAGHVNEAGGILVEYSGVGCVRRLLEVVLPQLDGLLDTNHGELVPYPEVLSRFKSEPNWDWSVPSSQ
ncbi:hypothetical protein [Micromonospora sp. NPDC023814]|uniref:hypothetical protein n=1 Tax=Micromonospora sp. NPDC023814 TaxID=3154596 RepID=UPI0033F3279C